MSQFPSMPMWWSDFFNKTDHLSNEEQWAYAKLMAKTWIRNCKPFPDNAKDIARLLDMGEKRWLKIRPRIAPFFDLSDGTWRQLHLENVFLGVTQRAQTSRSNGALGGRPLSRNINMIENPAGSSRLTQIEPIQNQKEKRKKTSPNGEAKEKRFRLPADFERPAEWLDDAAQARARHNLPPANLELKWERFFNWSQGGSPNALKTDWHLTWINWCLDDKPALARQSTFGAPGFG